jgi:hypothetical protein
LDVIEDNGVEQEIRLDNMPDTQVSRVSLATCYRALLYSSKVRWGVSCAMAKKAGFQVGV